MLAVSPGWAGGSRDTLQPLPHVGSPKSQLKPKRRIPAGLERVPHPPGFCSITARAPRAPPAASPPLPPGAAGVPPFSSGCLSGSQRVRGWGQDATVFPGARHCDGVSPPGAPPMSPNATAPGGGGRASVPRPSRGSLPPFRAGLSPAPVALPALGWGHWDTGGPEGLETRARRQGQAWGVGPAQRDDVVGLSFGMLSPLAVPRFL